MRKFKKIVKRIAITILVILLIFVGSMTYLYKSADMCIPQVQVDTTSYHVEQHDGYTQYGNSYLRHSEDSLWELKVQGTPIERGVAFGKLTKSLLYYQEKTFVDQIKRIIPSDNYLKFLRYFIIIFNRNMGKNVTEEYRKEIYGISLSCTHEFDYIGSPYERQLNYHGAHDIGHTMQDYMLVGCSSFGVWGNKSADSSLIIGRNFDFYVGDDFAKNKLISFYNPSDGYKFVSVGWAGMVGVLSGMNEKGLTVTINAAKTSIPTSAATPISLLAREILQYASTIDEAYAIAQKRKTFVSESILIGSAQDGRAAIIEKSPDQIALYDPDPTANEIICTNHFQSKLFSTNERNIENIKTTDSPHRYARMAELLKRDLPIDPIKAASILRNRFGEGDKDIGLGNELALNQFIAHHAVIFKPQQGIMWVSTSPWQLGKFVAYDLHKIFASNDFSHELYTAELTIPADSMLETKDYQNLLFYKSQIPIINTCIANNVVVPDSVISNFIASNPNMYYVYALAGDYYHKFGDKQKALADWNIALTKAIPRLDERKQIEKEIERYK